MVPEIRRMDIIREPNTVFGAFDPNSQDDDPTNPCFTTFTVDIHPWAVTDGKATLTLGSG